MKPMLMLIGDLPFGQPSFAMELGCDYTGHGGLEAAKKELEHLTISGIVIEIDSAPSLLTWGEQLYASGTKVVFVGRNYNGSVPFIPKERFTIAGLAKRIKSLIT